MRKMIPMDELMKRGEDYMKGMHEGEKCAIEKYNKMFVELWDKINDMQKLMDERFVLLFNTLKILEGKISH